MFLEFFTFVLPINIVLVPSRAFSMEHFLGKCSTVVSGFASPLRFLPAVSRAGFPDNNQNSFRPPRIFKRCVPKRQRIARHQQRSPSQDDRIGAAVQWRAADCEMSSVTGFRRIPRALEKSRKQSSSEFINACRHL